MVGGGVPGGGGKGRKNRNPEGSSKGLTWTKVIKESPPSTSPERGNEAAARLRASAPSVASSLSTAAAEFVPGSSMPSSASSTAAALSKSASEFVPGGGSRATTALSASAADFKPSEGSGFSLGAASFSTGAGSFSAGAAEFVPGSTSLSTGATEFVPSWGGGWQGQSGGWGSTASGVPSWSGAAYGGSPAPQQQGCWFNADAYSDRSSSSSPSPRQARTGSAAGAAAARSGSAAPAAEAAEATDAAAAPEAEAAAAPGAGQPPGEASAEAPPREAATAAGLPSWSGLIDVVPFEPAKASTAPPPRLEHSTPPGSLSASPQRTGLDAFASPLGGVLSEPAAATSESEAEWTLPEAVVAEMSERALKMWLQRFANDGDTEALRAQWQAWLQGAAGAQQEVYGWLLRTALDDCRSAEPVLAILRHLLHRGDVAVNMVKELFDGYTNEDDLADMVLDNPKVVEFVDAFREMIAECARMEPPAAKGAAASSAVAEAATDAGAADAHGRVYSLRLLVEARRPAAETASAEDAGPRWRTEPAAALFKPAPSWMQHMAAQEGSTADDEADRRREGHGGPGGRRRPDTRDHARGSDIRRDDRRSRPSLQVSDTSWVAQSKKWKVEKGGEKEKASIDDEAFVREMRGVLNKLTIEKFDHLSDQIILLVSRSARPNKGIPMLMQLVFEKATTQHHFINMYVSLCVKLHKWLTANEQVLAMGSQGNFKRILLNQCQSSFENYLEPPEGLEGLRGSELYEAQVKYKTKMLGNIKLVGELIRNGMLAPKIALAVSKELSRDDPAVREERLETLAVFLETVGPALDDKGWSHHAEFEAVFAKVERVSADQALTSRIRFLLRDLLDLRRGSWQMRRPRELEKDAPTTIAEVHEKARQTSETLVTRSMPSRAFSSRGEGKGGDVRVLQRSSTSGAAMAEGRSREEQLAAFKREIAATFRSISEGGDPAAALRRLRLCPLPPDSAVEEAVDLIARIVDEPRSRRRALFRLLPGLCASGVFSSERVLKQAVDRFIQESCADPDSVDPPDLGEMVLDELLPVMRLAPSSVKLPQWLVEVASGRES